jgi:hypothetical protein
MPAGIDAVLDGVAARRTSKGRGDDKGRRRAQRDTAEWTWIIRM